MLETAVVGNDSVQPSDDGLLKIEALPARIYHTPQYGEVPVTRDKLDRFVDNFNKRVRGQDISTDFDHGADRAKGNKASGWIHELEVAPSSNDPSQLSLFAVVKPTDEAAQEIRDKQWKYFSLEWEDEWMDNSGITYRDVVTGGAFTNRPIAKNMMPINFSEALWNELDEETQKQFAVLTSAQRNALPKSAFLHVEPDGTTHLPYRKANGSLDLAHLRAAITRLSQKATGTVGGESWLSDSLRTSLLAKARRLLAGANKMSEAGEEGQKALELIESLGLIVIDEEKEWEHSEPGTGPTPQIGSPRQPDPGTGQPVPRIQGDPSKEDPGIGGGWRTDPLEVPAGDPTAPSPHPVAPNTNALGGDTALTPEQLKELRDALGLGEDTADDQLVERAKVVFSEHAQFMTSVAKTDAERKFAEDHPVMWREHQDMLAEQRDNRAKSFSESIATVKRQEGEKQIDTKNGLSALALEEVQNVHKKFSEGTATSEDFEGVVKTIMHGGIVDFGEVGSSTGTDTPAINTSTLTGLRNARMLFAEKVNEAQREYAEAHDGKRMEPMEAVQAAAAKYPDLADAYQMTTPA